MTITATCRQQGFLMFLILAGVLHAAQSTGQSVARPISETRLVDSIMSTLDAAGIRPGQEFHNESGAFDITRNKHLLTTCGWTEVWPSGRDGEKTVNVTAEIWTAAIQSALDEHRVVFIPERNRPYYIDAPLVLRSTQRLIAAPRARIRLKPRTNTCMVRNRNLVDGRKGPVRLGAKPDTNIIIEGGIWSTLATRPRQTNGNAGGRAARDGSLALAHATILLSNVRRVVVRNVSFHQCIPFGVQIANASEFLVENITFEEHGHDGVHVDGPARNGIIRNISGETHDDMVALNAWGWNHCRHTFGPISRVLVEEVKGSRRINPATAQSVFPDGTAEIRLIGGTKNYSAGRKLACEVTQCVVRNIHNLRTFKLYDQPHLLLRSDCADPIGHYEDLFFSDIHVSTPDVLPFQIAANANGITIRRVKLYFDMATAAGRAFKLVRIGPMSATCRPNPNDPSTWEEIFSPDKDCTVKGLSISEVQAHSDSGQWTSLDASAINNLILLTSQKPNTNYPATIPRGGNGQGRLVRP